MTTTDVDRLTETLRNAGLPHAAKLAQLFSEEKGEVTTMLGFSVNPSELFPSAKIPAEVRITLGGGGKTPLESLQELAGYIPNRVLNGNRITLQRLDRAFEEIFKTLTAQRAGELKAEYDSPERVKSVHISEHFPGIWDSIKKFFPTT